jgi:hypothetical protein
MHLRIIAGVLTTAIALASPMTFAAVKGVTYGSDNSNVPPQAEKAPALEQLGFYSDEEVLKAVAENFKEEAKRRPSGGAMVGTEDMLSKEYVDFREKIIHCKTGDAFYALLRDYDKDSYYNAIPAHANDLKFAVARMSGWLPMRGIAWRMTPLVHKVVVTQQMLLTTLRNYAEQMKINEPDSHVQAQMLFLTMPSVELIGKQFTTESQFVSFLTQEVYPSLARSAKRLQAIKMVNVQGGKESPLVFDARIRFGEDAFNANYNAYERFKIEGEAERYAALARIHRRMFNIASMAGYNWNGHLALRREIGQKFGVGAAESTLFDMVPGESDPFVKGVSRDERVKIIKRYNKLYTLIDKNNKDGVGRTWTKRAYFHLHESAMFLEKTWAYIKKEDPSYVMQIDPEVFIGRKEQIEAGIANLKKLVGATGNASGRTKVPGALSGEEVTVDLKAFYEDNPPEDLKNLLPVSFAGNEDLAGLKNLPGFHTMSEGKNDIMKLKLADKNVSFRNYLYGRSKAWNPGKDAYGTLFPELKSGEDVANAMRIMNEVRGGRVVSNGLTAFIR